MLNFFFPFITVFVMSIYFIPSIIAIARKHLNSMPIVLVNVFLGWTFVGWVVALVWACSHQQKKGPVQMSPADDAIRCAPCGSANKIGDKFCMSCGASLTAGDKPKEKACATCGTDIKEGTNFCPKCGGRVG